MSNKKKAKKNPGKDKKVVVGEKSLGKKEGGFDPSSSYVVTPISESENPKLVKQIRTWMNQIWEKVTYPLKRKKEFEELGLHEDFDPSKSYVFESRKQGIRTWKDFFLVYFVMILAISSFVAILVYHGYLENPLLKVVKDPDANPRKIVAVQDRPDDTYPDQDAPRLLELNGSQLEEPVSGRFVVDGSATASFISIKLEVYDSNDLKLGSSNAGLKGVEPQVRSWTAPIDIEVSPTSDRGYLLIYPYYEDSDSDVSLRIPLFFANISNPSITLNSPIPDQLTNQNTVLVRGSTVLDVDQLRVSLTDDIGEEIFSSTIDVNDDGNFDKSVVVNKVFGADATSGSWKIFDGETLLLTVPVRFQP